MDDLLRHLDGIEFPATKDDLIDSAIEADAAQEVVERLQTLSREQYETAGDVERELADQGSDPEGV